jgi:hypothetical protein
MVSSESGNDVGAREAANREEEDYRDLNIAALEKLDPSVRSRTAILLGSGLSTHPLRSRFVCNDSEPTSHISGQDFDLISGRDWIWLFIVPDLYEWRARAHGDFQSGAKLR